MPDEILERRYRRFRAIGAGLLIAFVGVVVGLIIANLRERHRFPDTHPSASEVEAIRRIPKPNPPADVEPIESPSPNSRNALADLNRNGGTTEEDLRILDHLFRQSLTVFKRLPTGTHEEIVRFYLGDNPRQLSYFPADHSALDEAGRLLDRWGVPYVFHPLSHRQMEVRSAGPDTVPWTEDDIVFNNEYDSVVSTEISLSQSSP